jgi:predicted nucleotidyltransferase
MNLFIESHQELLRLLLEGNVNFIVIGGYSVIYHGYKRTTGDVDIWVEPDNGNRDRLVKVLESMEFDANDLLAISEQDFTRHLVFSIGEAPEKVDFLTHISSVKYEEADTAKIIAEVDGLKIPFLHLNHLVLSKFNTGRAKDKADVEELQKIRNRKGE